MVKIIQGKEEILRTTAKEVIIEEIGGKKIKKIIKEMKEALDSCDDGIALAAPQIGVPLRLFVVSPKVYGDKDKNQPTVFINPKITSLSKKTQRIEEGCLSLRWLYGEVKRAERATVEARDERGIKFTRGASGLLAQVFQHELDHLQGVLFTDKAKNVRNIPPEIMEKHD